MEIPDARRSGDALRGLAEPPPKGPEDTISPQSGKTERERPCSRRAFHILGWLESSRTRIPQDFPRPYALQEPRYGQGSQACRIAPETVFIRQEEPRQKIGVHHHDRGKKQKQAFKKRILREKPPLRQ